MALFVLEYIFFGKATFRTLHLQQYHSRILGAQAEPHELAIPALERLDDRGYAGGGGRRQTEEARVREDRRRDRYHCGEQTRGAEVGDTIRALAGVTQPLIFTGLVRPNLLVNLCNVPRGGGPPIIDRTVGWCFICIRLVGRSIGLVGGLGGVSLVADVEQPAPQTTG